MKTTAGIQTIFFICLTGITTFYLSNKQPEEGEAQAWPLREG
jgi:hypothetical protein